MSDLSVDINWHRTSPTLAPGEYENSHDITYSADYTLPGDAAPDWGGDPSATNPEQAIAASLSSCHMMTFLALAAKASWPVATYSDHAAAKLGTAANGRKAVTDIKLTPRVTFDTGFVLSDQELQKMHARAHRYCFVANSISANMEIEPAF